MTKQKIRAIGFDWDGTLVDSMSIKSQSFAKSVVKVYPQLKNNLADIENLYINSRGNSRTDQLALVQKKYNLPRLSSREIKKWSDMFTAFYINKKLPLFPNVIKTLQLLTKRGYRLFLCSSVPQADLDDTLTHYPLNNNFEFILGTGKNGKFKKGIPHLSYISKKMKIPLEKIAFCGDGADDVKGANEAGCFSIGKIDKRIPESKKQLQASHPDLIISKLKELHTYFK